MYIRLEKFVCLKYELRTKQLYSNSEPKRCERKKIESKDKLGKGKKLFFFGTDESIKLEVLTIGRNIG